ncbi:cytochrome P450 [Mycena epipterygia]|nr:cytochrome P450 [Mycena epipterygia]
MPKEREWKIFAQWAKDYGDWFNRGFALMPYFPRFHSLRRLIHKELTGIMLQKYWPLHEDESRTLVKKVLQDPDAFSDSIRHYSGSVILRVTYGYQTAPQNDKFLVLAEEAIAAFAETFQSGPWAVDVFPWLRHLPSWVPGMKFKQTAAAWHKISMEFAEGPFEWALANQTVAALSSFFLAMALYPEVQPIGPLGIPHLLTKDDIYRDYQLPAGSIVMANVWSILRDPLVFPDPDEFRLERLWTTKSARRGIRIEMRSFWACTGVHFAEASMFIAIATALSQCNIRDPINSRGEHIRKDVEYQTGTLRYSRHL